MFSGVIIMYTGRGNDYSNQYLIVTYFRGNLGLIYFFATYMHSRCIWPLEFFMFFFLARKQKKFQGRLYACIANKYALNFAIMERVYFAGT